MFPRGGEIPGCSVHAGGSLLTRKPCPGCAAHSNRPTPAFPQMQVSQRMMAVDLAPALLAAAGEPFQTSAAALEAAAATPGAGAGPLVAAPPGAICLAILAQRCGDRAAPVRARALGTLAAALSAASSFNGGSSREEVRRGGEVGSGGVC